jgi:DNA-binding transcriptional LysR family regulator
MRFHFDLADLRLMVHVAEANSLTRGAEAMHLSLPAASTRIKHLEESIGAKLLYRTSQGVTLTPPGQAFVHHARIVLAQIEHLGGDLQEYAKGIKGHLRVYANTTALGEFLPPVLRSYLLSHPDVNIDLRERLSHAIVRAVSDGQTDIGIVAGLVRTEALQVIPYRRDRLVLVVPHDHALAGSTGVAFAETLDLDHVGLHEASAIHAFLRDVSDGLHRRIQQRIQVGNFEAACRMIEANVGVGILPQSAAQRHAHTMRIRIVPLVDAWALRAMQICVRNLDALPGFARDLVQLLIEDAQSAGADGTPAAVGAAVSAQSALQTAPSQNPSPPEARARAQARARVLSRRMRRRRG